MLWTLRAYTWNTLHALRANKGNLAASGTVPLFRQPATWQLLTLVAVPLFLIWWVARVVVAKHGLVQAALVLLIVIVHFSWIWSRSAIAPNSRILPHNLYPPLQTTLASVIGLREGLLEIWETALLVSLGINLLSSVAYFRNLIEDLRSILVINRIVMVCNLSANIVNNQISRAWRRKRLLYGLVLVLEKNFVAFVLAQPTSKLSSGNRFVNFIVEGPLIGVRSLNELRGLAFPCLQLVRWNAWS